MHCVKLIGRRRVVEVKNREGDFDNGDVPAGFRKGGRRRSVPLLQATGMAEAKAWTHRSHSEFTQLYVRKQS